MLEVNRLRAASKAITDLGAHRQYEYRRINPTKSLLEPVENRLTSFVEFYTPRHALRNNSNVKDGYSVLYS